MEKLLTFGELCRITGVKRGAMRAWLDHGQGPSVRWTPGGKRRFLESDVRAWLQSFSSEKPLQSAEK
ncbi:MAG: helix-turn-helix domain-containing protein [Desulfomonilaceae bacterium]